MTELLTAAQMRAIERAAIDSGVVTGLELMERAGAGVVEAVFEEWPDLGQGAHRAVVLCGPGNNGGDGFVVARLLKERGWEVEVFLYGDPAKLPPDAKVNYERWGEMGDVRQLEPESNFESLWQTLFPNRVLAEIDVVVDALFGTGLTRAAPSIQPFESVVHAVFSDGLWWNGEARRPFIVAIDNPSDMCIDSGRELVSQAQRERYEAYAAHLTVTFHRPKIGQMLDDGQRFCTKLRIVDIGLGNEGDGSFSGRTIQEKPIVRLVTPALISRKGLWLTKAQLGPERAIHKYSHGHALILSGGFGKTGAARLAARGALRIGAGLVTLGVPGSAQMEVAGQITALMLRRVEDAKGLAAVLEDQRINALCLGPGLGLDRARDLVPVAVRAEHTPYVVLDADALTAFADASDQLFEMLHPGCVLTPHGGEFARLFPDIARRLREVPTSGPAYSKVDATRDAAKQAGCIVLFKGPDTVIADTEGRCSVNAAVYDREAPWLATAGSGDVLAGFITGLLARGFAPMQAAETAAWLHVECARSFGPGLIAEDLPEELPRVFRALGL